MEGGGLPRRRLLLPLLRALPDPVPILSISYNCGPPSFCSAALPAAALVKGKAPPYGGEELKAAFLNHGFELDRPSVCSPPRAL